MSGINAQIKATMVALANKSLTELLAQHPRLSFDEATGLLRVMQEYPAQVSVSEALIGKALEDCIATQELSYIEVPFYEAGAASDLWAQFVFNKKSKELDLYSALVP